MVIFTDPSGSVTDVTHTHHSRTFSLSVGISLNIVLACTANVCLICFKSEFEKTCMVQTCTQKTLLVSHLFLVCVCLEQVYLYAFLEKEDLIFEDDYATLHLLIF